MVTIAVIGSRDITPEERDMIIRTARWCARHGLHGRSGGARGADDAWEEGWASVDAGLFTVAAPDNRARRPGVRVIRPPYPDWVVERAVAEWTFGERLAEVGLPPYADPALQARFEQRSSWRWLEQQQAARESERTRRRPPNVPPVRIEPNDAFTQRLMIRNAAIVCPSETEPVSLVLGLLSDRKGGGGTGHAFRLARALGVEALNLRSPVEREIARERLERLVRERPPRSRSR